jgi:hypothetical protein
MTEQQNDSGTTGIGDDDLDENGQADATPDQAETGGSGGAGLTRNEGNGGPGSVAAQPKPVQTPPHRDTLRRTRRNRHHV